MNNSQPVSLSQSIADLLGDADRGPAPELTGHPDHALQVLPRHIFHGDEMRPFLLHELVHFSHVPVGDLPGELELVAESLDGLCVGRNLRFDQLKRHFFIDLLVEDPIDLSHAALS